MQENRTVYPKRKTVLYQQLQELPQKYKVLALVKMEKVRASQLLPLRKKFQDEVVIISIKDKVAKKALANLKIPGIEKISERLTGQCLFMFTNMSPFKLNTLLGKNKIMLSARGGDTASIDIVIPPKNTGLAPGPILTDFKEVGVPTKIDQGTVWILKETTPVKKGGEISPKLATLLGKLDIKPVEAGISLYSALEEGIIYSNDELDVNVEKYREQFAKAFQEALSLSIEVGYVTPENIKQILTKASQNAQSLSMKSGYISKDNRETILQTGHANAQKVASKLKDYSLQ